MKTTKEQRSAELEIIRKHLETEPAEYANIWLQIIDDADEAERLEAENAKLRKRLEGLEKCVEKWLKRIYEDALG